MELYLMDRGSVLLSHKAFTLSLIVWDFTESEAAAGADRVHEDQLDMELEQKTCLLLEWVSNRNIVIRLSLLLFTSQTETGVAQS